MDVLNNAFNKTLEGRIRNLANGDFRGAFRSDKTVVVEQDPDISGKYILRFGPQKDDRLCESAASFAKKDNRRSTLGKTNLSFV